LATATMEEVHLGEFTGCEIVGSGLIVRNAGDGLSDAMELRPQVIRIGDRVGVYLEGVIKDVQHPQLKNDEGKVKRIHVLKAEQGVIVNGTVREQLRKVIARQERELQRKREREVGIDTLDGVDEAAEAALDEEEDEG